MQYSNMLWIRGRGRGNNRKMQLKRSQLTLKKCKRTSERSPTPRPVAVVSVQTLYQPACVSEEKSGCMLIIRPSGLISYLQYEILP